MFDNRVDFYQREGTFERDDSEIIYTRQMNTALDRFRLTLLDGKFSRLKRKVLHRPQWLYDLNSLKPQLSLSGSYYAGIQVVPIESIIGSECRIADFDIDFYPLREASRERWVSMAMVLLARLPLPLIELIQVGSAYFVRDGHNRISVSRAFGQVAMDAEVIVWKASPPFPWQLDSQMERHFFLLKNSSQSA